MLEHAYWMGYGLIGACNALSTLLFTVATAATFRERRALRTARLALEQLHLAALDAKRSAHIAEQRAMDTYATTVAAKAHADATCDGVEH